MQIKAFFHAERLSEKLSVWMRELKFSRIPTKYLEWSFSKSSGPGGQNVNKINSKANLIVTLHQDWIPMEIITKIEKNPLIFKSDIHRNQHFNQEECQKSLLKYLIKNAMEVMPPSPPSPLQQAKVAHFISKSNHSRKILKNHQSLKKSSRRLNEKIKD